MDRQIKSLGLSKVSRSPTTIETRDDLLARVAMLDQQNATLRARVSELETVIKNHDDRVSMALEHGAALTQLAVKLCNRILGDGGDLNGLEQDLERLGVPWSGQD